MFSFLKKKKIEADVTILYGTHTGNSKFIAKKTAEVLRKKGIVNLCKDVKQYDISSLEKEKNLLLIISTHGEGEPPQAAEKFYRQLMAFDQPLPHLSYSVCALGDKTYEHFCLPGRSIHQKLQAAGARPLAPPAECDVEYEKPVRQWIRSLVEEFQQNKNSSSDVGFISEGKKQFTARVLNRCRVNDERSDKEVFQLTIGVDDAEFQYQPGDSLAITPQNDQEVVERIIALLGSYHPQEDFSPLREALTERFELSRLSSTTLRRYNDTARSEALQALIAERSSTRISGGKEGMIQLLEEFPAKFTTESFLQLLTPMQPRYYSVASSQKVSANKADLLIRTLEKGVATPYLNHRLEIGQVITVRVVPNPDFHLPGNQETPVIMIANGVGLAPFRAFMQELEGRDHHAPVWLMLGERNKDFDFLYRAEWEVWQRNGSLNHLHTAFSRGEKPAYVQALLEENKAELINWISQGAAVYVCGSVPMGEEVRKRCDRILEGKITVELLKQQGRYAEELF
ncbi:diflavin oxidoreductase [Roseimarinus sediminis]|uniref:diflavin oxidoreductase n=1 Tax=Roseimarinus sediminis TaxID=1610899 RepID=UPI003D20C180